MRRNSDLYETVQRIRKVAYGIEPGNLKESCDEAVQKLKKSILEKELVAAISEQFTALIDREENPANLKFAVRSSGVGEDSDDASSAGQNETFLGLRNLDEILESVKLCWASLFTYQSVEYRRQHVQPIDTQMSVVVQIMVHSDCAGVLFTQHPVSGDPSKILITANFGLGESVVSGRVDPDSYIVERMSNGELSIISRQIGNKTHFLHMNFDDGENVLEKKVSAADQSRCCLRDDQVLNLSKIGVLLEHLYGNARDVEWAVYQVVSLTDKVHFLVAQWLNFPVRIRFIFYNHDRLQR
ncbi:uncharacterized phosphotransferase YvkC-like [Bradysia coprophila]|uniref:uncharacterized phosphotransferase YvkC-like n=1 Tax=Bradysia coprophila TaxID=38358 RepID=UPI00187DA7D4|nr:uncharacterized phosphotransferase YvkC-like [Bradysia coprophila]